VSQVACVGGCVVGAIGCRLQMKPNGRATLYVLSLGVLAPHRNERIGEALGVACRFASPHPTLHPFRHPATAAQPGGVRV